MADFWGHFMKSGHLALASIYVIEGPEDRERLRVEEAAAKAMPPDAPAESVLDELDESGTPLPMVGEPGSEVTVAAEETTPPSESFLDYIDTAPAPQPATHRRRPPSRRSIRQRRRWSK